MTTVLRAAAVALATGLLVAAGGCGNGGGGRAAVRGKVTLDGQPVEAGLISFVPAEGTKGPSAGAAVSQGEYEVQGDNLPVPGAYRVEIKAQKKTGKKVPVGSPAPPGTMAEETVEAIPARYNTRSTLREELKPGSNVLNFDLTSGEK
ncbi:MAG: hypothetical protein JWO38_323 [Gemmataceae bacterium]|nr:hypothetical protein [Gemmataceae bacterium]